MFRDDLPEILTNSIGDPDLLDIGIDITEFSLDLIFNDEFLKELPIVGILWRGVKIAMSIPDRIFTYKLQKILSSVGSIPDDVRKQYQQKIADDPNFSKKVGSSLITIIDRLEDLKKPELLGKIVRSYLLGDIKFVDVRRLATAIDIAFIDDINELVSGNKSTGILVNLLPAGLSRVAAPGSSERGAGTLRFFLTEYGEMLIKCIAIDLK